MKNLRFIILAIVIILVEFLFLYLLQMNRNSELKGILNNYTSFFEVSTKSAVNAYNLVSKAILTEVVQNDEVLEIFSKAYTAVNPEKKLVRERLYEKLLPTYIHLKDLGIRQLHFHLPNNESFLRFHRPGKYGDDLTDIRYSVKQANMNKRVYSGFEEGRIYNGFRYVFPLSYNHEHIGSVETSFSFDAIRTQLLNYGIGNVAFMIDKEVVMAKVFSSEAFNYSDAVISDQFVNEIQFIHYDNDTSCIFKSIDNILKNRVQERLSLFADFSELCIVNGVYYIVSFVHINNVEGKPVAYLVSYMKESLVPDMYKRYRYIALVGLLLLPLIIFLMYSYIISNTRIKTKNRLLRKSERALHERNLKLKQQTDELNETIAVKNKIFSIVAHDLINPFGAIREVSALMLRDCKQQRYDRLEKFSDLVHRSSSQSAELLVNMLNWSRVQTGRIKYNPERINIKTISDSAVDLMLSNIDKKGLDIVNNISDNIIVKADRDMLDTVLRNLISNAIKFTPTNGIITLNVELNGNKAIVSVSDTGVGIREENFGKVFKVGDDNSTLGTEDEKGTGLGLILCKEFVEENGGEIWFESKESKGTTFFFTVPVANV